MILQIVSILKKTYPDARIVLKYGNNWELLVSVILSAQCTDKKVNEVTSELFAKFRKSNIKNQISKTQIPPPLPVRLQELFVHGSRSALRLAGKNQKLRTEEYREIANFAAVPLEELEQDIKSTGFYRNKAKNIQAAAKMILEKFGGKLPRTMAEMVMIPGVARKTANVVLGNAYGVVEGIAVDTHVLRLSQRLRLVSLDKIGGGKKPVYYIKAGKRRLDYYKDASPEKIERELMEIAPKKDWFNLTYWLIDHGRAICKAQKPDCGNCSLRRFCPVSRV